MKQKITINNKTYEVEIEDPMASPVRVTVNGKAYEVVIDSLTSEPVTSRVATPAPVQAPRPVVAAQPRTPPPAPAPSEDGGKDIRAPMPGVIIELYVKAGDEVKVGQPLCALEAMKMKNVISSTLSGVVAGVDVSDGQRVKFGDVLVRFQ